MATKEAKARRTSLLKLQEYEGVKRDVAERARLAQEAKEQAAKEEDEKAMHARAHHATKIQAVARGRAVRRRVRTVKESRDEVARQRRAAIEIQVCVSRCCGEVLVAVFSPCLSICFDHRLRHEGGPPASTLGK